MTKPDLTIQDLNEIICKDEPQSDGPHEDTEQYLASVAIYSIFLAAQGRQLAFTRDRRGAHVPEKTLASDLMCLLPGGSVPYFIRPVSNSEPGLYNFVGEYWVEGLMYYQRDELSLDDEIKLM